MKSFFYKLCLVLFCMAVSAHASATELGIVRAEMASGNYAVASVQAEKLATPEGYALAAEALLSEIMLGQARKNKTQAKRARDLAQEALALDPTSQNARLQYAIADGFVTRETGDVSAWMKKLPQKTQAIVQAYRADFPDDVRGDALLGAWHLAIVRKAGDGNARKWFGASVVEGRAVYGRAIAAQPNNAVIGVNYAFALIALDDEDMPDVSDARRLLERLSRTTPSDHLNATVLQYGREALLRLDNRDAARDYAGLFLDGKTPE